MTGAETITTPYDGCGKCLVATRRLSRKTDKTSSPERQAGQDLKAAAGNGGHIIAWADDWEVSGATDPLTRPGLGPWLRGEMGPYDGLVSASVDRIGRNVRDTLNTQALLTEQGRVIITADHVGVWDFSDTNQENEWLLKALGSQLELRGIQKRNDDETKRARQSGEPKQRPAYGYRFERPAPNQKISAVVIDDVAAGVLREVKDRVLAAFNGDLDGKVTCATEAARLTRAGVPSPLDRICQLYARPVKGRPWTHTALRNMLRSEAALGCLMHKGRPVIGDDGRPVRIAPPLWDRTTHEALLKATAPRRPGPRAQKSTHLLSGIAVCGQCGARLYLSGSRRDGFAYGCTGRVRGLPASQHCKPAPSVGVGLLDARAGEWFLAEYGWDEVMDRVWDPGDGHAAGIKDLEAARSRLRADRLAGLYDAADDAAWFQREYRRMGDEIAGLRALPERKPGFREVPTGRTVADDWEAADGAGRREMLAERGVRVVVRPRGDGERVTITAADGELPLAADAA